MPNFFFVKEWDSIVCFRPPINTIMNLLVSSLFEQMLVSQ